MPQIFFGRLIVLSPVDTVGVHAAGPAQDDAPPVLGTYHEVLTVIGQGKAKEAGFRKEQNIVIIALNYRTLSRTYYPASKDPSWSVALPEAGAPIRLFPDWLLNILEQHRCEGAARRKGGEERGTGFRLRGTVRRS